MESTFEGQDNKSLRSLLGRIGLEEKEIEIYLALLSLKHAKASEISKHAKQSRSHAYLILRALEKKGLVAEIAHEGILQFVAEPPERLLSYLKDREREYKNLQSLVQGALPLLSQLSTADVEPPRVTLLKGLDGMKQVYRDILSQEFVGIYNAQTSLTTFGENVVTMLFGKDAKLKGRDLIVNNEGAERYIKDIPPTEEYFIRLLPKGITFQSDTIVFGDTITLFAFDEERTIIRIQNKKIADSFRAWFEMMWKISTKPS